MDFYVNLGLCNPLRLIVIGSLFLALSISNESTAPFLNPKPLNP